MDKNNRFNNFEAEVKMVREYLKKNNATQTKVEHALDIYRPNLCGHGITLQQAGEFVVTHQGVGKITGYHADYLSCDPEIMKGATDGE
jgi:hypothetical protein